MSVAPLQALPLEQLRQRSSTKWRKYGDDVLPFFVAETDYPPAPAITAALSRAVALGDTGYTPPTSASRAPMRPSRSAGSGGSPIPRGSARRAT
nr:hypothetical protein GCM10025699_28350 [Microbacterium flavescens]